MHFFRCQSIVVSGWISVVALIAACGEDTGIRVPVFDDWTLGDVDDVDQTDADVIWSGTRQQFVVATRTRIAFSVDGTTWDVVSSEDMPRREGVITAVAECGSAGFLVVTRSGEVLSQDEDGVSWRTMEQLISGLEGLQEDSVLPSHLIDVACTNGTALLLSHFGPWFLGTPESHYPGVKRVRDWDFVAQTSIEGESTNAIIHTGIGFVGAGDNGMVYATDDGSVWTAQSTGVERKLNDIAWDGTHVCAVGDAQTIVISSDLENWAVVSVPGVFDRFVKVVSIADDRFVVFGEQGTVVTVVDKKVAGTAQLPVDAVVTGAAFGAGVVLVTTADGVLIHAVD